MDIVKDRGFADLLHNFILAFKKDTKNILLVIFLLIFLFKGIFYAAYAIPLTTGATTDDVGHITNIMYLSDNGRMPIIGESLLESRLASMWHSRRGERIIIANDISLNYGQFFESKESNWIAQHPPSYYILMLPFYKSSLLFTHSFVKILFILRCVSVMLGLFSIFYIDRLLRLLKARTVIYSCVLSSYVFSAPIQASFASVSNDPPLILLCIMALYYLLKYCDSRCNKYFYILILLCSLIILTKYTGGLVVVCYAGYYLYWSIKNIGFKKSLSQAIKGGLLAITILMPLFVRNILMYGSLMPSANFLKKLTPYTLAYEPSFTAFLTRSGYPEEIIQHMVTLLGWGRYVFSTNLTITLFAMIMSFCAIVYLGHFIKSFKMAVCAASGSVLLMIFAQYYLKLTMSTSLIFLSSVIITIVILFNKAMLSEINNFFIVTMYFVVFIFLYVHFGSYSSRGVPGATHGRYYFIAIFPFLYLLFYCFDILEKENIKWVKKVPVPVFLISFFIETNLVYRMISSWSHY